MYFIALNNIRLFAQHGLYAEEKILGNNFVVNCKVGIEQKKIESIDDTIDYALLSAIIHQHFAVPTPLLETVAARIEDDIMRKYPVIRYFYLSIKKLNPALNARADSSEVIIENNY
ncbi:MAG: dihydroneopterin aldolase [Chitinophagaceae bacterium]|nr:dihydroneopterin aldolase [Chitinophagaceae bacterium]